MKIRFGASLTPAFVKASVNASNMGHAKGEGPMIRRSNIRANSMPAKRGDTSPSIGRL